MKSYRASYTGNYCLQIGLFVYGRFIQMREHLIIDGILGILLFSAPSPSFTHIIEFACFCLLSGYYFGGVIEGGYGRVYKAPQ